MNGKGSRNKGSAAEREVVRILNDAGLHAEKRGAGFSGDDLRVRELPSHYLEIRRREQLRIPAWCREIESKADGRVPVLIFRRSHEPWRVVVSLDYFIELVKGEE